MDINDLSYSTSIESMTVGNFYDVSPKAWYASGVQWAVDRGITVGTAKNTFSPSANCTNAQILTFIWRFAGQPESKIANPFTNTIFDGYFKAAKWAYEMGLISGSIFDTDTLCTRAMAMTYLWKISGHPKRLTAILQMFLLMRIMPKQYRGQLVKGLQQAPAIQLSAQIKFATEDKS